MLLALPTQAAAGPGGQLALALALILVAAKLGGDLAERLGQPAVLGELLAGVLLGNLDLVGVSWFRTLTTDVTLAGLAEIGVVLLLFEVGLESTIQDMRQVGWRSLIVAMLAVFPVIVTSPTMTTRRIVNATTTSINVNPRS